MANLIIIPFAIFIVLALGYFVYVAYAKSVKPKKEQKLSVVVEDDCPAILDGVLTEQVGVETLNGVFTPIIDKGVEVPCRAPNVFSTGHDNQSGLEIKLYRGKEKQVKDNHFIGTIYINGIPLAPKGVPEMKITIGAREAELFVEVAHKFGQDTLRLEFK